MSSDRQSDVRQFHIAGKLDVNNHPIIPSKECLRLRLELIREEMDEVIKVLERMLEDYENAFCLMGELADGVVDSEYVLLGTLVSFGINSQPIWDVVQKSNMLKLQGNTNKRDDGKITKPWWWRHPNIQEEVEKQL